MNLPGAEATHRRGLLWWLLAVVVLTVVGASGVRVFAAPAQAPLVAGPPPPGPTATPRSAPSPVTVTPPDRSPLHTMTIPDSGACAGFRSSDRVVPADELEGYLSSILDCLMTVNEPAFHDAGLTLRRPALAPDSEVGTSGCVSESRQPQDWAGLYCPMNGTIYYRTDWTPDEPLQYLDVLVHEYVHHLQREAGILDPVSAEQDAARGQPNGALRVQELSRRVELQAECAAAAMVGPAGPLALAPAELTDLVESLASVPPEWAATHGSGRAQTFWFKRGADVQGPQRYAGCNTFSADAALVE